MSNHLCISGTWRPIAEQDCLQCQRAAVARLQTANENNLSGWMQNVAGLERKIVRLETVINKLASGIMEDDIWQDNWCPVCHEHPNHDHGGKDCPMRELAAERERGLVPAEGGA